MARRHCPPRQLLRVNGSPSDGWPASSRAAVIGCAAALLAVTVLPSVVAVGGIAASAHGSVSRSAPAAGTLRSWGSNSLRQLGDGSTSDRDRPVTVKLPSGTKVTSVRVGCGHSLALTSAGIVLAWGSNHFGQAHPGPGQASQRRQSRGHPGRLHSQPGPHHDRYRPGLGRQHRRGAG